MIPASLRRLTGDGWLLFATRFIRLFAYGSVSVVLVFYLVGAGLSEPRIGTLLTLTLAGDTLVSLYLTTRADRIGRGRVLIVGALLMAAAGLAFASTSRFWLLLVAGTIGVISPSGNEVGPFLSDRAGRAVVRRHRPDADGGVRLVHARRLGRDGARRAGWRHRDARAAVHRRSRRWTATGPSSSCTRRSACCSPRCSPGSRRPPSRQRGGENAAASSDVRQPFRARPIAGRRAEALRRSSRSTPSPAASSIQSFAAYWFYLRFGVDPGTLGAIFFWANILAGISALLASTAGGALRPDQHDGRDAPAVQRAADPRAADADAAARHRRAAGAVQHQSDGRADAAVVPDGCRHARKSDPRPRASRASRARSARR